MSESLAGKTAIVTGAGSGIGREVALTLADAGAYVVVSDIADGPGQETVDLIGAERSHFWHTDIADRESVDSLIASTIEKRGRLDIAHNNAGISGALGLLADISPEEWATMLAINLTGTFFCLQAEIKAMLPQGGGVIINTASVLGAAALTNQGHYIASKHAIVGLTKAASVEYSRQGIRVNAVLPGPVQTPLMETLDLESPGFLADLAEAVPVGRLATTKDIANAVLWLASDASSYVHGTSLLVDGGMIAKA
jgi:NAD(P)-dependent dehydrogenase (short-subunit alcohol dehydrogenase family)